MKKLLLISALMMFSIDAGHASTGRIQFWGGFCIETATAACVAATETEVGKCYEMRFSPPGLGINGTKTSITLVEMRGAIIGAQNYTLLSGTLVGPTYQDVSGNGIYRYAFSFSPKARITSQTPSNLSLAKNALIVGNILDFNGVPGCDVRFRGSGPRHEF